MNRPTVNAAVPLERVLAIDPGRDKCGVAIVTASGEVLTRRIYRRAEMPDVLLPLLKQHAIENIVVGGATTSKTLVAQLKALLPHLSIKTIDEAHSTLRARALYWQSHPPQGWRRLLPLSLQTPPVAIDDYAAVVLARRHFARIKRGTSNEG